jgi:hypothetical protein
LNEAKETMLEMRWVRPEGTTTKSDVLQFRDGRCDEWREVLVVVLPMRPQHERADEIERLRAQVAEWEKLGDPVTLHANLLRGIPCRLDRATFLHLAGDETPNVTNNRLPGTAG